VLQFYQMLLEDMQANQQQQCILFPREGALSPPRIISSELQKRKVFCCKPLWLEKV